MKLDLEDNDIQAITRAVVDALKPFLTHKAEQTQEIIFDVPGLCGYLGVTAHWVHERTHLKEIPYYKLSNKQLRFRKKDIDKWLESCKTACINDFRGKLKILR